MRIMMKAAVMAAILAALLAGTGCEDSPVTAGANYTINLLANPSTVVLDQSGGSASAEVMLTALVLSDTGVPQKGFVVLFSTTDGELATGTLGVTTDGNGLAHDVLTVSSASTITVTATSTSLSATATVTVTQPNSCDANVAPVAKIVGPASVTGAPGDTVSFVGDAASSADPPSGVIVGYQWDCGDGIHSGSLATISCPYVIPVATAAQYTITLVVKDNGLGGSGPSYTCQKSGSTTKVVTVSHN
jgi:PKD domain